MLKPNKKKSGPWAMGQYFGSLPKTKTFWQKDVNLSPKTIQNRWFFAFCFVFAPPKSISGPQHRRDRNEEPKRDEGDIREGQHPGPRVLWGGVSWSLHGRGGRGSVVKVWSFETFGYEKKCLKCILGRKVVLYSEDTCVFVVLKVVL